MLLYKKWQSFLLHTEHCQWHHSGSDLDIVKIVFKRTQLRTTSSETPEKILSAAVANTVELPHQPTFRFPSRRSPQTINEHLIQHKCSLQFHSFQITIFYIERTHREIYIHFSSLQLFNSVLRVRKYYYGQFSSMNVIFCSVNWMANVGQMNFLCIWSSVLHLHTFLSLV